MASTFCNFCSIHYTDEEVLAYPYGNVILQENFSNLTFTCEAKEKVRFVFPNSYKFGTTEYAYNKSNIGFPYSASFTLNSNLPMYSSSKYMKINCVTEEGRRVLNSWEYTAIGESFKLLLRSFYFWTPKILSVFDVYTRKTLGTNDARH